MTMCDKYVTIYQKGDMELKKRVRYQPIYDCNPKISETDKFWIRSLLDYDGDKRSKINDIQLTDLKTLENRHPISSKVSEAYFLNNNIVPSLS